MRDIVGDLPFAALGQNIFDAEWDEPAEDFAPYKFYESGGVKIAVIGQAFPYTPIANPSRFIPDWTFGIRDEHMQEVVDEVRAQGAELVVVLSHNGFDVDKKMASVVKGIDVILSGHTHDALPEPVLVGETQPVRRIRPVRGRGHEQGDLLGFEDRRGHDAHRQFVGL